MNATATWTTDPVIPINTAQDIVDAAGTPDNFILTAAVFDSIDPTTDIIKVTVTAATFTDVMTIVRVSSGSGTLTGILTNELDAITAPFSGTGYTFNGDEGGEFLVYLGSINVTDECTFTVVGGADNGVDPNIHELDSNGLIMSIDKTTGIYSLSGLDWTLERAPFTLKATHESGEVTKRYTLVKIRDGDVGVAGTGSRLDFAYSNTDDGTVGGSDNPGNTAADASTEFPAEDLPATPGDKLYLGTNVETWTPPDLEPAYSTNPADFEWTRREGTNGLSSRVDFAYGNTATGAGDTQFPTGTYEGNNYAPATSHINNKYLGTDVVSWDSGGTEPSPSQLIGTYEWSRMTGEDGSDGGNGQDAILVSLSNGSHTIPTDSAGGNGDYNNSETLISVHEGLTQLDYDGVGTANSRWKVDSAVGTDITAGVVSAAGFDANVGSASNFTTGTVVLTAKVIYTVSGKTAAGDSFTRSIQQSFSKSLTGNTGGSPSIVSTDSGPIATTLVTHPSVGNNIIISWGYSFGKTVPGSNPPNTGTLVKLMADDGGGFVEIGSSTFTEVIEGSGPTAFWSFIKTSSDTSDTGITGNISYKLELSGAGSFDNPSTDSAFIIVTEAV
jgi:hypothetical protein